MSIESIAGLIGGGTGSVAVLVIFLVLMLSDKLHTDGEFEREVKRGDLERDAHAETRKALTAANERADAAVRAASLIADAMTGRSESRVPQTKD
jgi:hypothetical protein